MARAKRPKATPLEQDIVQLVDFASINRQHREALGQLMQQQAEAHNARLKDNCAEALEREINDGRARACFIELQSPSKPEGEIVGLMTYTFAVTDIGRSLYLEDMVIHKDFRHVGIGSAALFKLAGRALTHNCRGIKYSVGRKNKPALGMYKKFSPEIDFENRNSILYFHEAQHVNENTVDELEELGSNRNVRLARESDRPALESFLRNHFSLNGDQAELAVATALYGQTAKDRSENHFCIVSTDQESQKIDGVMICSRGLSTFLVRPTTHVQLLKFNDDETLRQVLPAMLHAATSEQLSRDGGTALYIHTDYMPKNTYDALKSACKRMSAKIHRYGDWDMIAGTLVSRPARALMMASNQNATVIEPAPVSTPMPFAAAPDRGSSPRAAPPPGGQRGVAASGAGGGPRG